MTNADKIRQMSDEELLTCFLNICGCNFKERCFEYRACRDCLKAWLAEEADAIEDKEDERK